MLDAGYRSRLRYKVGFVDEFDVLFFTAEWRDCFSVSKESYETLQKIDQVSGGV